MPATEMAAAVRARRLSAVELLDAHLRQIEAVNPELNAVVQLDETAHEAAAAADAAVAKGDPLGPLHGVPFTTKDWLDTVGVVSAGGFARRADFIPRRDATVVARMREAGAILLGKTNVRHDNPVHGRTNNPYDAKRSPGYSSAGEAAIIAARGSPLGLGSDSGGSIRFPAHCCGIAGLKPTNGRVPNTGHFPRISALNDPRTQIGPMARHVSDLALALPVIAGVDWRDASVIPMPLGPPDAVNVSGLRVAYYTSDGDSAPSTQVVKATNDAVRALRDAGASVEERRPPRLEESLRITERYWARIQSGASWNEWIADGVGTLTGDEVDESLFEWDRLRRSMISFIEGFDVIICPAAADHAPLQGEENLRDFAYTLPYSLTGWPSVVLRAGTSDEGMPIGVQVVAQPWRDDVALAVAQRIEEALGGWQPPP